MSIKHTDETKPITMAGLLDNTPAISTTTTCHEAAELFRFMDGVIGFAVLQDEKPVGIISREKLTIKLASQFGHPVYGKRPVTDLMTQDPLIVDINETIDRVEQLITDGYEHALSSGFIIVQDETYIGMGNVLSLMRESVKRTRMKNQQLEKSTQLAEHANEVKSQFLAGMSHELRTPLNAIIGFSELIVQESFGPIQPPRYGQYVEDILESGRHLLSMISDILDMSKIEAGRYDLNEQPVEVNSIARNVIKMCRVLADKKNIKLKSSLPNPSPILIGDARALKQMLVNLISNGIKYTEAEGEVFLEILDLPQQGIQISIKDTGAGIAEDELSRIMEPFVQVAQGRSDKTEGTGLGLAIVKALAELQNTDFTLSSSLGIGTTAQLTFPEKKRFIAWDAA